MKTSKVASPKQPNNGLLGTYFGSLFSVVLSCVMLLGTTYAWFNNSSSSTGNVIETGAFNITMSHLPYGEARAVPLSTQSNYQVFSSNVEWKPETTQLETIELTNTGTLSAACKVEFVHDTSTASGTAEQFWVYVKEGAVTAAERGLNGLALANTDGWTPLGKLSEVMGGQKPLFAANQLRPGESRTFSIALYTPDPTPAMGQSVELYLHLIADQLSKTQQ